MVLIIGEQFADMGAGNGLFPLNWKRLIPEIGKVHMESRADV